MNNKDEIIKSWTQLLENQNIDIVSTSIESESEIFHRNNKPSTEEKFNGYKTIEIRILDWNKNNI